MAGQRARHSQGGDVRESADVTIRLTRVESFALAHVIIALAPFMALAERHADPASDAILVGGCALIRIAYAAEIALGGDVRAPDAETLSLRASGIGAAKRMAARDRLGSS